MVQNNVGGSSMLAVVNLSSMTRLRMSSLSATVSCTAFEPAACPNSRSERFRKFRKGPRPSQQGTDKICGGLLPVRPTSMSASPFGCSPASLLASIGSYPGYSFCCVRQIHALRPPCHKLAVLVVCRAARPEWHCTALRGTRWS